MVDRWRALASERSQAILALILVTHFLLALPIILQPTWVKHEADFYNVARTLVRQGRMPTAADFPDQPGVLLQVTQPPLYHVIVAAVLVLFDGDQPVPPPPQPATICFGWQQVNTIYADVNDSAWYAAIGRGPALARGVLRFLNVGMLLGAVVLVYATVRLIAPQRTIPALLAAALLAFEPNTLGFTAIIGNDSLLLLISAVLVYAIVRSLVTDRLQIRLLILVVGMTICAILARLNGWALLPISGLLLIFLIRAYWRGRLSRRARRGVWIGLGVLFVGVFGIVVVNFLSTGSLFGRYRELDAVLLTALPRLTAFNSVAQVALAVARDTSVGSYLTAFDFVGHPRLIAAFGWFTLFTLAAAIVGIVRIGLTSRYASRLPLLVLVATVASTVLLVFARNLAAINVTTSDSTTLIFAPLRYYAPALPAAAILIALGLSKIRFAVWLGGALVMIWLFASIVNSATLPIYVQPAPSSVINTIAPDSLARADNLDERYPQLIGYQSVIDDSQSLLDLTMVTDAGRPLAENYSAKLQFTTPSGRTVGCQFPLAQGLYPPMLWQVGETVKTEAHIPSCVLALPAETQISLRWVSSDAESPPISLGRLAQSLSRAPTCPPLLGSFDDKLLVTQYTAPLTARAGTLYLPAVNWYVSGVSGAFVRTYKLTAVDGTSQYMCESQPRLNTYPFATWTPGETIYFDECDLHLPADAVPGSYVVSLGVRDAAGNWLSATDASGQPMAASDLLLATIDLLANG